MALKIENRKIETVGQLRSFLCESIVDVRNGNIRVEIASQINKMAAQVNESFYSECKVARTMKDNGKKPMEFGKLNIGDGASIG